jgi:hypothetical protein
MHYAPPLSAPRSVLVPMLALVIGAGGALGAYAILDETDVSIAPTRVIVADQPVAGSGTATKNEAGTASAISTTARPGQGTAVKDEARTASAIGTSSLAGTTEFGKDEAATAAAVGSREPHIGGGPPAEPRVSPSLAPAPDGAVNSRPGMRP